MKHNNKNSQQLWLADLRASLRLLLCCGVVCLTVIAIACAPTIKGQDSQSVSPTALSSDAADSVNSDAQNDTISDDAIRPTATQNNLGLGRDRMNLQQREYFLRIGVEEKISTARVVPDSEFVIHDREGRTLYSAPADSPIRLSSHGAAQTKKIYYVLIETFSDHQLHEANTALKHAKEILRRPTLLIPDPRYIQSPSPLPPFASRPQWAIVVGPYATKSQVWNDWYWIEEEYKKLQIVTAYQTRQEGIVEARNAEGKLVASAVGYLGIRPNDPQALTRGSRISSGEQDWQSETEWENDRVYRGAMEVWANPGRKLTLVNRVFIEQYLRGVVPPEIGDYAPLEMKKVQAVISRSEAIAKLRMGRHDDLHFDLCDRQHCQVYLGAHVEDGETNQAIEETWGQVAIHKHQIIDAVYSLSCGGVTANSQDAWGQYVRPYLKSRIDQIDPPTGLDFGKYQTCEDWVRSTPDVFCNPRQPHYPKYARKYFRWTRSYSADQLAQHVRNAGYGLIDKVTNISITRRTPSGLISEVRLDFNSRRSIHLRQEFPLRRALGRLPSAFFTLERDYDPNHNLTHVTIRGAGKGHGVGLCQMGAMMMAYQDYNYHQIISHYFQDTEIYRIYR